MKVIICYPPLSSHKGSATLGQNRQFQYFKEPTYIYPVVPAQAATLLQKAGHEVIWLDCLAAGISYNRFIEIIKQEKPDLIAFETKTPVVKQHWKIINALKELRTTPRLRSGQADDERRTTENVPRPTSNGPLTVLYGDHVTALPEESLLNSKVDFVLTGGDYDFLLLNLCNFLNERRTTNDEIRPTSYVPRPTDNLEPGIYYRAGTEIKNTGKFQLNHDLDSLPFIDRVLTKWQLYAFKNGNYKRTPGTYIMSGRDCWWGQCRFCSWTTLYPHFRSRSVGNVLDEIGQLIQNYGVREIMDDSGSFPTGEWLRDFCRGMLERGYNKKIYLDCNMRFGALSREDFSLMKRAGFRLLLFGLESANQATLDRLNKGVKVQQIAEECRQARRAGLFPHITIMFGCPWESYDDARKTMELGRRLLIKGCAYTMQATMVIPYPGTPLFEECRKNNWLKTQDWDDYDMKQPVMNLPYPQEKVMELVQGMYKVSFSPEFILRKILSVRDADDLKYAFYAAKKVFGHVFDFRKR